MIRAFFRTGLIRLSVAWLCVMGCVGVAQATEVYWAGFAYLGPFESAATNYPHSIALFPLSGGQPTEIDKILITRLGRVNVAGLSVVTDRLGVLGPDSPSAISLALALDRETVSVEQIGGKYKILYELSGQVLIFDFHEGVVIACVPIVASVIDYQSQPPNDALRRELLRNLYLEDGDDSLVGQFLKALAAVPPNLNVQRRIQVTEVSIAAEALAQFPEALRASPMNVKMALAQQFGAYLARNQRTPILPYAVDYAIGNRMAGRFANGTAFDLKFPKADYTISLRLENLKRKEWARVAAGATILYTAFLHVTIAEPLSDTRYLDATIAHQEKKIVPADQPQTDDWAAFQATLQGLMEDLTAEISSPRAQWAQAFAGGRSVAADLVKLQKVLQSCRS